MTTIGSTAYYSSTTRYGGSDKSGNSNAATSYTASPQTKVSDQVATTAEDMGTLVDSRPSAATVSFQGKLSGLEHTFKMGNETLKGTPIWELPEAEYQDYLTQAENSAANLESQYTDRPWEATVEDSLKWFPVSPATTQYATVTVAGKVIATIDNQGVVSTENDELGKKLSELLLGDLNGTNGPDLAQARADQVANLHGGRVTKSDTAMTQLEFNNLPSTDAPTGKVDWDALQKDAAYTQLQSLKEKREEYLARQQPAAA